MLDRFSRTRILLGAPALEKLARSRVAVFGVGGVGGYTVEALARSGIGSLDLIDNDTVSLTNINRQIIALQSTVGRLKTEVAAERARDINPDIKVCTHEIFYSPDTSGSINLSQFDYIVDAIESVSGKIELAVQAKAAGVPIISAMGAGNKLDPTAFEVSDIFKTSVCPLARVMRYELKKRGIKRLKVVYSKETPLTPIADEEVLTEGKGRRSVPGSTAFVPSVVGLIIASEVIKDLTK